MPSPRFNIIIRNKPKRLKLLFSVYVSCDWIIVFIRLTIT